MAPSCPQTTQYLPEYCPLWPVTEDGMPDTCKWSTERLASQLSGPLQIGHLWPVSGQLQQPWDQVVICFCFVLFFAGSCPNSDQLTVIELRNLSLIGLTAKPSSSL